MKSLFVSLLFLFSLNQALICQDDISWKADIIIEGQVMSITPKWNKDRTHIISESIINSNGTILFHSYQFNSHFINVSMLPAGIYICRILSNKEIVNRTFIKI